MTDRRLLFGAMRTSVHHLETKNPSSNQGRRGTLRGTTLLCGAEAAHFLRYSGRTRWPLAARGAITVNAPRRVRPIGRLRTRPGFHHLPRLAGGWLTTPAQRVSVFDFSESGPRGIRTLDLLNAIETRSQLRYGPGTVVSCGTVPQVDLEGFEPSTSSVRLRRAPNCATGPQVPGIVPEETIDCQGKGSFRGVFEPRRGRKRLRPAGGVGLRR